MDVYSAANAFVAKVNAECDRTVNANMKNVCDAYRRISAEAGRTYIKLIAEDYGSKSAFGFIIINDNNLGKSGDILKAASWKAPAKGARGNVFSTDNGMEAIDSVYGSPHIRYLK